MKKSVLWTIKIIVIFIVLIFMAVAKDIGFPVIAKNIIGFAIIFTVWKYKPSETNDNNENQEIDKS